MGRAAAYNSGGSTLPNHIIYGKALNDSAEGEQAQCPNVKICKSN